MRVSLDDCPTHQLTNQSFSLAEMRDLVAKASQLHICADCRNYLEKQITLREAERNSRVACDE
jgi:hypothetical protein